MNIKEANEIIKEYENDPTSVTSFRSTYTMAKGYLQGIEKADRLAKSVKKFMDFYNFRRDQMDRTLIEAIDRYEEER